MLTRSRIQHPQVNNPMWYTISLAAVVRFTLETGGENEGVLGYLQERDDGEVGCCRACVGELPHHQLRGDISAGQGQETRIETTAEGGSESPGDTSGGALQPSSQVADVETGMESVFALSLLSH